MQDDRMKAPATDTPGARAPMLPAAAIAESVQLPLMLAAYWWALWADMFSPPDPHHRRHHRADHLQLPVAAAMDHELFA